MRPVDLPQPKIAPERSWRAWKPISGPLVVLLSALSLQACSTTGTAPMQVQKVSAPEQCMVLASPLPLLADPTLAGAVRNHLQVAEQYWELAERHRCLVEFERAR